MTPAWDEKGSKGDTFMEVYAEELSKAVAAHPEDYGYGPDLVPVVVQRMRAAFSRRSYNKDSRAIKATCKRLGIGSTYKAINAYLEG